MKKEAVKIYPAQETELIDIKRLAKKLDLDLEDIEHGQFITAKRGDKIIGFGRLRRYPECTEIATVGVVEEEQKEGIGRILVSELIKLGPSELYVTCVIPDFFKKFGFQMVKQYPAVLQKKVDFCISYDYKPEEVFVMKLEKMS